MDTEQQKGKTPLIFHGHFYQPPRENPRTGIISKQLSASPWSDWNELITSDCYRANCYSRYLDGYGSITSLSNNYEVLSFNFGPTLLTWLQQKDRRTYEMIIEADKASIKRLGHGNAIAQVYSHAILPLSTVEDARTQILWGLDDFSRRFGRDAKGLWLSETAINKMVIDVLAQEGVEFVILSPWQCRAIERGGKRMVSLDGKPAPYDRPFILSGEQGGKVTAFFYNPQLAEGISFGHYLRDADQLYGRLKAIKAKDRPALIQTATDGEIYGHHEPYGDMALAALAKKVAQGEEFYFTNYSAYLADHPATERATLHDGEDGRGTSWSCFHGVSRWYKDCGCHTGGDESWNQKWRTPLRNAFEQLGHAIDGIWEREVAALLPEANAAEILNGFSPVASELIPMSQYVSTYSSDPEVQEQLATLLLGQKYKHYAFTSCGWFFNDIAGLEPRQNIAYALMAIAYYLPYSGEELMMDLFATLAKAKANRAQDGTGETIANEELQQLSGEAEAAFFFALNHQMAEEKEHRTQYGYFRLIKCEENEPNLHRLEVENTESLKRYRLTVIEEQRPGLEVIYRLKGQDSEELILTQDDIPLRMRDDLFELIERSFCRFDEKRVQELAKTIHYYSSLTRSVPYLPMGSLHQELIGASLAAFTTVFSNGTIEGWQSLSSEFELMVDFFLKFAKQPEIDLITAIFDQQIHTMARQIESEGLSGTQLRFILDFLSVIRAHSIEPEMRSLQEEVYPYLVGEKVWEGDERALQTLATEINFNIKAGR